MPDLNDTLKDWLVATYGLDAAHLTPDAALFSSGLLDSFNMLEVVSQYEKLAGKRVRPLDLNLDNFDSLAKIRAYAARHAA